MKLWACLVVKTVGVTARISKENSWPFVETVVSRSPGATPATRKEAPGEVKVCPRAVQTPSSPVVRTGPIF